MSEQVKVTADMVDTSDLCSCKIGEQTLKINYKVDQAGQQAYTLKMSMDVVADLTGLTADEEYDIDPSSTLGLMSGFETFAWYEDLGIGVFSGEYTQQMIVEKVDTGLFKAYDDIIGGDAYYGVTGAVGSELFNYYTPADSSVLDDDVSTYTCAFPTTQGVFDTVVEVYVTDAEAEGTEGYLEAGEYWARVKIDPIGMGMMDYATIKVTISGEEGSKTMSALGRTFTISADNELTLVNE